MRKSICAEKSLELLQCSSAPWSFSKDLANMVKHKGELENQEKIISIGVLDDKATKSDSFFMAGEDEVDKNVILDKTIPAQGKCLDSPFNILHSSFWNMLQNFAELEDIKGDIIENNAATFEGDLHILKGVVRKLAEICQDQEIKLAEFTFGKHLQSIQGKSCVIMLHDLYVNLLQDIAKQLSNLMKELKRDSFEILDREKDDSLKQELERTNAQVADLEQCLGEKIKQIKYLNDKTKAIQSEIDTALMENFDLHHRLKDVQKESNEQKYRIKELVGINEELLLFAQGKESKLNNTRKEFGRVKQMIEVKVEENIALLQDLTKTRKEMEKLKDTNDHLQSRYKFLSATLAVREYELSHHDEAIERLTKHLLSACQSQDFLLEQDEKLQFSLKQAHSKEQEMEDQVRQSWRIIQKLEDKLDSLGSEISKTGTDIIDMKEQNDCIQRTVQGKEQKAFTMQKEVVEMQYRVMQLEDEVMEKEGQISILRSSYPGHDEF